MFLLQIVLHFVIQLVSKHKPIVIGTIIIARTCSYLISLVNKLDIRTRCEDFGITMRTL